MQCGLRYLGLGTWERGILEIGVMQCGLRYLGLGTWERGILEIRVMQCGLRYLGLGTWERGILEIRPNSITRQVRTPSVQALFGEQVQVGVAVKQK